MNDIKSDSEPPKGWHIDRNLKPIPDRSFDYDFWHDDYDGENGLCGNGASKEDCLNKIKEIEEEVEPEICMDCAGSGEGYTCESSCSTCHGWGIEPLSKGDDGI